MTGTVDWLTCALRRTPDSSDHPFRWQIGSAPALRYHLDLLGCTLLNDDVVLWIIFLNHSDIHERYLL